MLKKGIIVKNISNMYTVDTNDGVYECTPRGIFRYEKITPFVGDYVDIDINSKTIMKIYPRTNCTKRPPIANINYVLIVTSVKEPNLSLSLLDRLILIFEAKKIEPILIFSKLDLLNKKELNDFKKIMNYYRKIGYKVFLNNNLIFLKWFLRGKITFLAGQTGVGKSTLLNKLNRNLNLETKPISLALGRGVHTTRHTEIHKIANFYIADTPGFSSIDIIDMKKEDIKNYFKEFKNVKCEYADCNHVKEDCQLKKEVEKGKILKSRYQNYLKFYMEVYENSGKLHK